MTIQGNSPQLWDVVVTQARENAKIVKQFERKSPLSSVAISEPQLTRPGRLREETRAHIRRLLQASQGIRTVQTSTLQTGTSVGMQTGDMTAPPSTRINCRELRPSSRSYIRTANIHSDF
jgi:hypothetical protein